jgi:hypothetical protein
LVSSLKEVLASLNHAYTLTYVAKGVPSGGWHTISVSIARPGDFVAGARRGYMGQ